MKKYSLLIVFVLLFSLVSCKDDTKPKDEIKVDILSNNVVLEIDESFKINFTTNDSEGVNVSSDDPTIVETLDNLGNIKALKEGVTNITITSVTDTSKTNVISIKVNGLDEVILGDKVLIKAGELNKEVVYNGHTYVKGSTLFNDFKDMKDLYQGKDIMIDVLAGTYTFDVNLDASVTIIGHDNPSVKGNIKNETGLLTISGINFITGSKIEVSSLEKFEFNNNKAADIAGDFLVIKTADNVIIENNEFENISGNVITILDMTEENTISINKNIFDTNNTSLVFKSKTKLFQRATVTLYRNKIVNSVTPFNIDLGVNNSNGNYSFYARFNDVTNFDTAVKNERENNFDFTLNYWGQSDITGLKFENVKPQYLLGAYASANDFVSEDDYNPKKPIYFEILNKIDTIELGDSHLFDFVILPYTAPQTIKWITSKPNIVRFNGNQLSGVETEKISLTASPTSNGNLKVTLPLEITTDPGIHLVPSNIMQNIKVGDKFTIKATPFPYDRKNDSVSFESSNTSVATVNSNGEVTIISAGLFYITALSSDGITEKMTFESYENFDDDNIMDFITSRQTSYSTLQEFIVYGAGFNFNEALHENVSRLLFQDIERSGDYITISEGVRPGTKKNSNIEAKYKFNKENIVWIVVHETANTSQSSSALSHHNYLMGQANRGEKPFVSWHSTVDSEKLYQHIPFDEIAWHAGDGSNLPGQGSYFGGGNRNGIGIEMSVNQNGNILKTWQRTAKYAAEIMHEYDLPFSQLAYHNDFSGKECPQSMRRGGYVELFEEFVQNELDYLNKFGKNTSIKFTSNNPEYLDNTGVVIKNPTHSMTVSYDVEVTTENGTFSQTYNVYIPGSWR